MHLLTGFIIAALAGKVKQNKELQGMPVLKTGPIQVHHVLPGRIRFRIEGIRQRRPNLLAGIEQLGALRGVTKVEHNLTSASLLVHFDKDLIPPPMLFAATVKLLGLEKELNDPLTSKILQELQEMGTSINRMVHEESHGFVDIKTLMITALIIAGTRKILNERWSTMPSGLTLLWWAYTLFGRGAGGRN